MVSKRNCIEDNQHFLIHGGGEYDDVRQEIYFYSSKMMLTFPANNVKKKNFLSSPVK